MAILDPPYDVSAEAQSVLVDSLKDTTVALISGTPFVYDIVSRVKRPDYRFTFFWDGRLSVGIPSTKRPNITTDVIVVWGREKEFHNVEALLMSGLRALRVPQNLVFTRPFPTRRRHPVEKPFRLYSCLVSLFTDEKDLVVDLFSGSGVAFEVCEHLGRRCIGFEISRPTCLKIAERMRHFSLRPKEIFVAV